MLILIPSWISNYIHDKVVNIITYPCPTFNHSIFEVWEWIINLISQFIVHEITYVWRDWNETILVKKRPLASDMCMTTISYILKIHLANRDAGATATRLHCIILYNDWRKYREEIAQFTVHSWDCVRKMHDLCSLAVPFYVSHTLHSFCAWNMNNENEEIKKAIKKWGLLIKQKILTCLKIF